MSRFTDYEEVRSGGKLNLVWKHELLDDDGTVLATTETAEAGDALLWGAELRPLAFQGNRVSQRTASMSVPVSDAALMPDRPGSLLHPESSNRLRVWAGISLDGVSTFWPQATMLSEVADASYESGISSLSVNLVDMIRPVRSELVNAFDFADGESVEAVVRRLLSPVLGDGSYSIAPTGFTTPSGSIEAGSKRDTFVQELLQGCGHELTTDPLGKVFSRLILPSGGGDGEKWRYGQSDGIPIHRATRQWTVKTPQGWRVEGGSFQNSDAPVTVTVYDTDPSSEGYFTGSGAAQIQTSRLPFVKSVPQAATAGYAQLRANGVGPMILEITSVPNPAMRENDLVDIELDELNASGTFRVLDYSLPIQVDGMMTFRVRKIYDPQVNYSPAGEAGAGCLPSFDDGFDRPDENLENLPPASPGSPDWTEHGWSWGVVNGQAIQRYQGGWSMALVNTPLCASDQEAGVTISNLPRDKFLGPVVRSSGSSPDGYAALADSNGRITIELWRQLKRVSVLETVDYGTSLVGKEVRLKAVGSTIGLYVNGTFIASVVDSSLTGTSVGMLALGNHPGDAPSVSAFSSGPFA